MSDRSSDVVIVDDPNIAEDAEHPPAKRQRRDGESRPSTVADQSSGTAVGLGGEEVHLVGEHVNQARRDKGKFPASQPAVDTNIKPEGHPGLDDFSEEDYISNGLIGLTDEQLAQFAAGGPSGATSSKNIQRRAALIAAFKRARDEQEQLEQQPQQSQLQQQHSAAADDGVIVIPDSDEEDDIPAAAHTDDLHLEPTAEDAAVSAAEAGLPPQAVGVDAADDEAEPAAPAVQQRQRQRPRQQQHAAAGEPANAPPREQQQQQRRPQQQQQQQQQQPQQRQPRPRQQQHQPPPPPQQQPQQQRQQQFISQDVLKRRKIRKNINDVIQQVQREQDQLTNANSGRLLNMWEQADDIAERTCKPREAAKHSELVVLLSEKGAQMFRNAKSKSSGRRPIDLVNALTHTYSTDYGDETINWKRLGADVVAAGLWRSAPGVDNMLGPLHAETKVRRVAQRRPKEPVAAQVRPVENPHEETGATQETDHWMQEMRGVLAHHPTGRVSLVQLVVNHRSFAQTVENIFALSFLVKDLWVRIEEDRENGLQVINITKQQRAALQKQENPPPDAAAGSSGSSSSAVRPKQFMMQIDMATWRGMCQIVPRVQGLMPHRDGTAQQQQQQQQGQQQQRQRQR